MAFVVRAAGGVGSSAGVGSALLTSLYTATISCAVIAVLGVPLAYLLAVGPRPAMRALTALVALPLALPPLMSGLLLLYVVGPYTGLGRLFDGRLTDTATGIVLAQTFVAAPFLVITARAAFAAVDPALSEVAASLGHGRLSRFWRFAVPAALPGIAAGLLLAWLRAFGEFGATVILAYHPYSLPVFTFVQFDGTGLPGTMLPIVLALGAALAVLALVQLPLPRLRRRPRVRGGALAPLPPPGPAPSLEFDVAARAGSFSLAVAHACTTPRVALLGASGAGKTLTLRAILGVHRGAHASVRLAGREVGRLPPERRRIGYVSQQPALLARRTVAEQVLQGRHAGPPEGQRWAGALGLDGLAERYPEQLSGGQQRRVALARALADGSPLLLLDEPFTGLDTITRHELIEELRALQETAAIATVLVTHDPYEARVLADEILIVDDGRVLQAGSTRALFEKPCSARVASILGLRNVLEGSVVAPGVVRSHGIEVPAETGSLAVGRVVAWSVEPECVELRADGRYRGTVLREEHLGVARELTLAVGEGMRLVARTRAGTPAPDGAPVPLELDPAGIRVFADGSEEPTRGAVPAAGAPLGSATKH